MDTYDIKDINALSTHSKLIKEKNSKIVELTAEIKKIANMVRENWQTEGSDLQSYLNEIEKCVNVLENSFIPAIDKYSIVLADLYEKTNSIQNRTLNN